MDKEIRLKIFWETFALCWAGFTHEQMPKSQEA